MIKEIISLTAFLFLLSACEKEIALDYRSVDPLYVIEGRVTNEITEVLITQTRDMNDGIKGTGLDRATVSITDSDGYTEALQYQPDGYYRSVTGLTGEVGKGYTLSVSIDEEEFTSFSEMNGVVPIDTLYFHWLEVMGERILFARFIFEDRAGEENYYHYRMYRNGEIYRWEVEHDRGSDGMKIQEDFFCTSERTAEKNKEEDWDEILYEGDLIELEIQTIDRSTYDYLYSLYISENTSANPVSNFTGNCLGYFSAYSTTRIQAVFRYADIE